MFLAQPKTWHRTDHLPLERNKVPSQNYLDTYRFLEFRTPDEKHQNSRETGEDLNGELGPVSTLSYVLNGGPVDIMAIASSQCKALFGYFL